MAALWILNLEVPRRGRAAPVAWSGATRASAEAYPRCAIAESYFWTLG